MDRPIVARPKSFNHVSLYVVKTYSERRGTRTHHLQLRRLTLYPDELVSQGIYTILQSGLSVKYSQCLIIFLAEKGGVPQK